MAKKKNISQRARFIEAARAAECSEDEAVFDRTIMHIANQPRTGMPKKERTKHKGGEKRLVRENDK